MPTFNTYICMFVYTYICSNKLFVLVIIYAHTCVSISAFVRLCIYLVALFFFFSERNKFFAIDVCDIVKSLSEIMQKIHAYMFMPFYIYSCMYLYIFQTLLLCINMEFFQRFAVFPKQVVLQWE